MRQAFIVTFTCCGLLAPAPASAQGAGDASRARLRIGPLTIVPAIALTNLGVDQNVFNEPSDANPKSDFTFTVTPAAEFRLRAARTVAVARVNEDLVWFQKYASERAANNFLSVDWQIPLDRFSLTFSGRRASVRDRPGFEIDARSQRVESALGGLLEVRVLPKTYIGISAERRQFDFAKDATFEGVSLQNELNRNTTTEALSVRYRLTPLTSVSVTAVRLQDRFDFSPLRNSQTTAGNLVVTFDPQGILSGSATVGYTHFEPVAISGLPAFTGPTTSANVSYRLLGTMRITVGALRQVGYSFDALQPYYVEAGATLSVTRVIAGPFDVVVRGGLDDLAYRDSPGAAVAFPNRVDHVQSVGAGLGYRMSVNSRLGFNVDKSRRISAVEQRRYDGLRFGSSVTYAF